jgi:RNA polymerase sigma-70 factor, ECF subfamily
MAIRKSDSARNDLFTALYKKYYRRIVAFYVRAFHLSYEDAKELAQDAFVRFYEAMDEYRGDAEWAFFEKIARNVAYNRIRSGKTKKRSVDLVDLDDPQFGSGPAGDEPNYAARQEEMLQKKALYEAIADLPPGQRQAMNLRMQGFSYEEIAVALRTTADGVRTRIRDAKKLLSRRLGGAFPEDEE